MKTSLVTIMRTERNNGDIDFEVVDFVNHAILLVDTARPSLFENKMFQVFHLSSTCSWMLLKLKEHVGNLFDGSLVAAFLDGCKLRLRLFGKKYNVCHLLQGINHRHDVLLALQTCKLGLRTMSLADVILHSLHVAAICKEGVARRANLVGVGIVRWLKQFASQPVAVAPRKRQALNISPKFVSCNSCHNRMINNSAAKIRIIFETTK